MHNNALDVIAGNNGTPTGVTPTTNKDGDTDKAYLFDRTSIKTIVLPNIVLHGRT